VLRISETSFRKMAHTKAKGTTKLGRDSESKRLGVKIYGGSPIKCGQIIIRQRGTIYMPGDGVKKGGDDTLFAARDGVVNFKKINYRNFNGNRKLKQIVSVLESQISKIKSQKHILKTEKLDSGKTQKINLKETERAEQALTEREIIREVELPVIPPRKDIKKAKSPVKHSHVKK